MVSPQGERCVTPLRARLEEAENIRRLGHPKDDSPEADAATLETIPLVVQALEASAKLFP